MSKRRPPPLMPKERLLSAINQSPPAQKGRPTHVYDSHVHLWAGKDILDTLYWQKDAPAAVDVVKANHDATKYIASTRVLTDNRKEKFAGATYVQIEVDHKPGQWEDALNEIRWLCSEQQPTVDFLTIVPWAPMDEGPEALESYVAKVKEAAGPHQDRIRGFRYIVQEFAPGPSNPLLDQRFVESLQWLAKNDYSHDFVVDSAKFGIAALGDIYECVSRVYAGLPQGVRGRFVIDHLGKPDLGSVLGKTRTSFLDEHERIMSELSLLPGVHVKYSGYLSSLPADVAKEAFQYRGQPGVGGSAKAAYSECKRALSAFVRPVLEAFGEDRIMWGGDWPICKIGIRERGDPQEVHDQLWESNYRLGLEVLVEIGLQDEALDKIFCQNAKTFYRVA